MTFIHVKNLDKFHPGYKDRTLQWAKIHFRMVQGDPDCEMIESEIDWSRLVKFILLELEAQKPIPIEEKYLSKKGFNLKKRPISLTINMLHNFINVIHGDVDIPPDTRHVDKSKNKSKSKSREEEDKEEEEKKESVSLFFDYFLSKTGKQYKLSPERFKLIDSRLKDYTIEQMKEAVDNFVKDTWEGRAEHMDLIYCIGVRNKVDNLEKWLNKKEKTGINKYLNTGGKKNG